jgi:hypothetical protein
VSLLSDAVTLLLLFAFFVVVYAGMFTLVIDIFLDMGLRKAWNAVWAKPGWIIFFAALVTLSEAVD